MFSKMILHPSVADSKIRNLFKNMLSFPNCSVCGCVVVICVKE